MSVLKSVISLGAPVLMPIIFFVIGLLFRVKIGKAFEAALLVGVGFTGLNMVIDLLLDNLGPATSAMVKRFGVHLTVLDTGWANASQIGWSSALMPLAVFVFLLLNILLFVVKFTKTMDIDIFNYWIFLVVGTVMYVASGSFVIAFVIMLLLFVLMLKVADWTGPTIQKQFNMAGLSFPHLTNSPWILLALLVNWVVDRIPGLNKVKLSSAQINKRFGVLGEPLVIGFILGVLIGVLAGFSAPKVMDLAVKVSASMLLLPKMVDILMEGLKIIRDAVEKMLKAKYPDREIFIGMDVALMAGDPSVMATGLILIPITLLLAVVLSGNRVLPMVDLSSIIFILPMMAAYLKKDLLRMVIAGTIMMALILYIGTDVASFYTAAAHMTGATVPTGTSEIISMNSAVTNPLGWLAIKLSQLLGHVF
ncbi:PTS galactitol transporter subunit IIC [Lactiplantibacillus pentosus]|uniref:Pts system, galactitol-specific iic component n=1 Tax=Lactiplantibacillus pentosus DSM 20314 TaxID=1423791 RepID=A0A837R8T9_LACPE|nr:PTS transporter subunit IIC [Lactiplantibacillus pentosus]AYJ42880.1 PTS galactitol transporter subunit IIC [Lactiplantibacillus pentosus]KRK24091.1 pts system, galactitol-specific iic component [Lactiplantibacillus pentosus DSM 20314]MCT3298584.1 PTS galactitol transporter subunit IIC [Lactiplantibacillus pentosus]MCT3312172.1 PTS galactitol transporter subunit IIC [Lactiplantibacillus pentosus]PKX55816.1 PTS galactitol transporter subunit IIC [Lactiplantibacillus pentosus]